jgi:AraC-like DNA-binding protein
MAKKEAERSILLAAQQIKRYLDAHPGTPVSTAALATKYGVSRNALQKFFKEKYKQPIGQYKLGLRLQRAQDLLRAGHSIKEVTIMLQYSSPSSFSNAFRNYYDISAKEWLQEINDNGNKQDKE